MRCQVPGCKNKATKLSKKNVLNCGVYLENNMVWHCTHHSEAEIDEVQNAEAEAAQMVNPMIEIQKKKKT
jgi:glutamate-1-semialdehyde aminotransferase